MKSLRSISFFSVLFIFYFLCSCEPAIDCQPGCLGKRVRNYETAGIYYKIHYDTQGRQKNLERAKDTITTFDFQSLQVTRTDLPDTATVYTLDNSLVPEYELVVNATSAKKKLSYSYTYDPAGQLVQSKEVSGIYTTIFFHTWVNGNLVKTVYNRPLGGVTTTIDYEYYPNSVNSVDNDFIGLNLYGKSSTNALKKSTKSFKIGTATSSPTITTTYDHIFDKCGCIKESTISPSNKAATNTVYYYEEKK